MNMPDFGRFFLPGPTEVHPEILQAMLRPMIPHRGEAMADLLRRMDRPLREIFRTEQQVIIGTGPATAFMEMAVRSGVRRRALSLVGGAFGERFASIVASCGKEVVRLEVPYGQTVEPDMLYDAIERSEVDAVTLVHSETATGALAPLEALAAVVHEFEDVMLLVDAVTSLAASPVETDRWKLDFVFSGAQKALALPPGLAFGAASDRMDERAQSVPGRGTYTDLSAYRKAAAEYQPTNTPAISLLYALAAQCRRVEAEGGIEARWRRHEEMRKTVERWAEGPGGELGFGFLPRQDRRSWSVSCLRVAEGRSGGRLAKAMNERGWTIGAGYGPLKDTTVRIGHMGDHTVDELLALLHVLEGVAT